MHAAMQVARRVYTNFNMPIVQSRDVVLRYHYK